MGAAEWEDAWRIRREEIHFKKQCLHLEAQVGHHLTVGSFLTQATRTPSCHEPLASAAAPILSLGGGPLLERFMTECHEGGCYGGLGVGDCTFSSPRCRTSSGVVSTIA